MKSTKIAFVILVIGSVAIASACSEHDGEGEDAANESDHEIYEEVAGAGGQLQAVSLCELVEATDDAGVVEIENIYGIDRADFPDDGGIYVETDRIETWFGTLSETDLRIQGGPEGDAFMGPSVSMAVGEEVVLLLANSEERTYDLATELQTFRPNEEGLLTNSIHFREDGISRADLEDLIVDIYDAIEQGEDCPVSEDYGLPEKSPNPTWEEGHDIDEGEADVEED